LIARKIVPQADDCPAIGLADTLSLPAAPTDRRVATWQRPWNCGSSERRAGCDCEL